MKLRQIIISSGIISLLLLQTVSATDALLRQQRTQASSKTRLINKIQDYQNRMQEIGTKSSEAKMLNKGRAYDANNFQTGHLKIDPRNKKDLHATIVFREGDKQSNSKEETKRLKLSKFEMEKKANEINIEHERHQLQKENNKLN